MNETLPKLNGNPLRVVVVSTWKKVCGLAFLTRHVVQQLESRLGSAVKVDIAEIIRPELKQDDDAWPNNNVIRQV
jgi:hypothetical protein